MVAAVNRLSAILKLGPGADFSVAAAAAAVVEDVAVVEAAPKRRWVIECGVIRATKRCCSVGVLREKRLHPRSSSKESAAK